MSELPSNSTCGQQMVRVKIRWLEGERTFSLPVPQGESTLADLLPAARTLAHEATALALEKAQSEGKEISCRAGCGACCRQLVAITIVEAQALAEVVAALAPERQTIIRQRFADAVARLEEEGLLGADEPRGDRTLLAKDLGPRAATLQDLSRRYFQLKVPCPFLDDESCSIHEQRPIVCREHHVTTPAANCAQLFQINVDRVEPPVRVGEALARTANRVGGHGAYMVPLVLSLEFAEVHGARLKAQLDGKALFQTLMGELKA